MIFPLLKNLFDLFKALFISFSKCLFQDADITAYVSDKTDYESHKDSI